MAINEHKFSIIVTKREGLKESQSIAQIKETNRITFEELCRFSDKDILELMNEKRKKMRLTITPEGHWV